MENKLFLLFAVVLFLLPLSFGQTMSSFNVTTNMSLSAPLNVTNNLNIAKGVYILTNDYPINANKTTVNGRLIFSRGSSLTSKYLEVAPTGSIINYDYPGGFVGLNTLINNGSIIGYSSTWFNASSWLINYGNLTASLVGNGGSVFASNGGNANMSSGGSGGGASTEGDTCQQGYGGFTSVPGGSINGNGAGYSGMSVPVLKTPDFNTNLTKGAGGGGAGSDDGYVTCSNGNAGGSGSDGFIILSANILNYGNIIAKGQNGSSWQSSPYMFNYEGGGGGGGGTVEFLYTENFTDKGTVNVSGGLGGIGRSPSYSGGDGGNGQIAAFKVGDSLITQDNVFTMNIIPLLSYSGCRIPVYPDVFIEQNYSKGTKSYLYQSQDYINGSLNVTLINRPSTLYISLSSLGGFSVKNDMFNATYNMSSFLSDYLVNGSLRYFLVPSMYLLNNSEINLSLDSGYPAGIFNITLYNDTSTVSSFLNFASKRQFSYELPNGKYTVETRNEIDGAVQNYTIYNAFNCFSPNDFVLYPGSTTYSEYDPMTSSMVNMSSQTDTQANVSAAYGYSKIENQLNGVLAYINHTNSSCDNAGYGNSVSYSDVFLSSNMSRITSLFTDVSKILNRSANASVLPQGVKTFSIRMHGPPNVSISSLSGYYALKNSYSSGNTSSYTMYVQPDSNTSITVNYENHTFYLNVFSNGSARDSKSGGGFNVVSALEAVPSEIAGAVASLSGLVASVFV